MFDNPEKYAKEKLKSKNFKQAKKALKNIEDINIKLPRKKNLYPAISIANWSGAILHINMGTAPFKYSDPMFKDGIFQISEQNWMQDMNGKTFLLKKGLREHAYGGNYCGNYLGLGIVLELLRPVEWLEEIIQYFLKLAKQ
jgi:hypothetical protein